MTGTTPTEKPLLQRRNSLTNTFQAIFDGSAIILLIIGLTIIVNDVFTLPYVVMILTLLGAMAIVYDRFGVYRRNTSMTAKAITLGKAWGISFAILLAIGFLTKNSELFSRKILLLLFVSGYAVQLFGHLALRYLYRMSATKQQETNALVIGSGQLASYIYERVNSNPWLPEKIVGTVAVPNEKPDDPDQGWIKAPALGELEDILQLVQQHNIRTVYIAVPLDASPLIESIYFDLLDANVDIHWAPNIFDLKLINHSVKEFAGIPILTLSETPLIGTHLLFKAIEDKLLATLALILLSPIMLLTAVAIKLESPGPIFFRQMRTGWDGKDFPIWKFRSMRVHQTENGEVKQATHDDPRITRVGRFIRRTSIDELPQLINVLAGQMSLVGPRPHAVKHNVEYSKRIAAYLGRHRIKPGITGLAQVRGFRGETQELEQMAKRIHYDLEYINNWSITLDLKIMVQTIFTIFGKNAY